MRKVIRENGFTYEVDERGNRYSVNLGTDVVSELEENMPIALNLTTGLMGLFIKPLRKLRDKIAPEDELQRIYEKEAKKKPMNFGSGLFGALINTFYVSGQITILWFQIGKCLIMKIVRMFKNGNN